MYRLALFSIVAVLLWAPMWAARTPRAGVGLRRAVVLVAFFNLAYVLLVILLLPTLHR